MEFMIPFLFMLLFMGVFMYFAYKQSKKAHERMAAIAVELGLRYVGPGSTTPDGFEGGGFKRFLAVFNPWRLEGTRNGLNVAAFTETRGSGRSRTTYTIVEAYFPSPLGCGLNLGRENALTKLGETLFNLKDIQLGSPSFDAAVRIKGSDPDRVKALLSPTRIQDAILQAMEKQPGITVQDDKVHFETSTTFRTAGDFPPVLDAVVTLAKAMTEG